tara:strand:- start:374 stop:673 length:300 start_codon:yes stop_codon:yes gene_type:complete
MKNSIRHELTEHIKEFDKEQQNHYTMFNEDYYIIGYYESSQWLKHHNIGELEGVSICNDYEMEHFGEIQTTFDNTEKLVNHLVYWYGLDLCMELEIPMD